jgi:fatty acid desaturase
MQFLPSMDFLPGLCTPAKFFLAFQSISVIAKTVFPSKERPLLARLKMLFLAILLIVGYTAFVNSLCDSADNHLAWVLVLIPGILLMRIWRK